MTGVIEFDGDGYRSNFNLDVVEVREEGIVKIGTWNSSKGLITSEHVVENVYSDPDGLRNKSFIVITCLVRCFLVESSGVGVWYL
jgi:ionotropic glutamate receptor